MRGFLWAWPTLLLVVSGACGGRAVQGGADDQSGAGATSRSRAGSQGVGGAPGGGQSSGGALSVAGSAADGGLIVAGSVFTGGSCGCPQKDCGFGFQAVPNEDSCCYHCECNPMLCPGVACPSGKHLETLPGQCCPTCAPDDCDKQRATYQDFKRQLVDKYAYGCTADSDCTLYSDENLCGTDCGVVVWKGAVGFLKDNLLSYAQQTCGNDCFLPVPACDAPPKPTCVAGRCE